MSDKHEHCEHGAAPADMVVVEDGCLNVDSETQARLEALLEAAGIGKLSTTDGKAFADPDVLHRLTSTVSYALDEAAAALSRLRAETGNQNQLRSLPEACSDGDVATVRRLLKEGQSVHETTEDGESLLSLACSAGYYELAEVLLSMQASTEETSPKGGCTPLMEAASGGFIDVVKLLIEHGAEINAVSNSGNTALTLACCGGYEDIVRLLLAAGADLEVQNENGHTPLMEAASGGHVAVAEILLGNGAGINTHSNEFKESALTLACYKGHLEMVRFLLEAGADQEHKTDEMHTALMEASMDGHVDVAKLLLDSGAQVNMPSDSFESPLTLAACGGHVALASLLLSRGASLEEVNDEGYTPLMEASREGHEEMVSLLLSHGAEVNAITEETRETALTLAACGGFMECCKLLIEEDADLEAGCSTALMEAAQEGHLELVVYLINEGAKVDSQTSSGSTALSYACEHGKTDVADALLTAGAFLEHESEGGRTPLMKACRAGNLCTVQYLLSKGANVNKMTRGKEHTALSLACLYGHSAIVELLLLRGANPSVKLKDGSNIMLEAARGGQTNIVQTLLDMPRMPNGPMDALQTKQSNVEEYPSRVPIQALPIVVPPHEPDPTSPTPQQKPESDADHPPKLEERIKKIIETNVKLKVVENKPHLQAIQNGDDSRLLKKQRILEELQKVEVDLQGKAAQQLHNCLNCPEFDYNKMLERDVPEGCETTYDEEDYSDGEKSQEICSRHGAEDNAAHNVSPAVSTSSLGKASTVSEECEYFFDVNCCSENNDTALTLAAAGGHLDLVILLLKRGANLEHKDKKGFTALILAATAGHVPVVNELLDSGANIESQSERTKDTALSLACSGGRLYVVQALVERGANIEHRNVSDYTPLSLGASGGHVRIIELLLQAGAEINSRTGSKLGISPLMLAAMNGHSEAVLMLLDMGADINAQIETNRNTALTLACFQGRNEVVSLLVERRANVEHRAKTGLTPLMEAASGGYAEVGKVLLDKGSDPNAPPVPSSKDTALTIAADKGHLRFCELVLSRGAIVDARNKKGNTSFWLACNGGYLDVARLLAQHRADINAVDNRNATPLMASFRRGHIKVVKWLSKLVKHFPTDSECVRYMSTITDRDLLKRCHACAECIAAAKERQGQQADKVMSALLEEIDKEKTREENRREKAVRKREKRKKKRQERQTKTDDSTTSENQTTDTTSSDLNESRVEPPVSPMDFRPKEAHTRPSGKPTVAKSASSQQPNIKKPHHRKDDEWKEVVRKSKKVTVPSNLIARIIGRGGCNINAIREETGAHIDINRQKKGLDRTITIRGPNHAIRHAYFLITELMKDENSSKDIASIFQTVKRDNAVKEEQRQSKRPASPVTSTASETPDENALRANKSPPPPPAPTTVSNTKKQSLPKCNTPTPPEIASANRVASPRDQVKPSEVSSANRVTVSAQSSVASENTTQFNPKYASKTINRPVQPVAPMMAATQLTASSPASLRSVARVEPQWQPNHQSSPQRQAVAGTSNASDLRQIYSSDLSVAPGSERTAEVNTFRGEQVQSIMHPPNQTGREGLDSSYSVMSSTANAMQQRKMWPIGTERAFQRRTTPVCEPMISDDHWHHSTGWDRDAGVHAAWPKHQYQNPHQVHGGPFMTRDHQSAPGPFQMMQGQGQPQMTGVPNEYASQQRLQYERTVGLRLAGYPMAGQNSAAAQGSHFGHEVLRMGQFPRPDAPVGQMASLSGSNAWPFGDRLSGPPVHAGRGSLNPIGHMKQTKSQMVENKNVNYAMQGMHLNAADPNSGMHGGSSGSASYVNPEHNAIWKW